MKEQIRDILLKSGAVAVGFSKADDISDSVVTEYQNWLKKGYHGEMTYLERHLDLKKDITSVLKDARTVISLAFSYRPENLLNDNKIAAYAVGEDYHIALRDLLKPQVEKLKELFGGKWRICIDSAPVFERYLAVRCGIGIPGLNGNIIVEGTGSYCFLVELLTDLEIEPDTPSNSRCPGCGRCIEECPGMALKGDGTMDARKCLNYLTIEKKSELSEAEKEIISREGIIMGCDKCLRVCPLNQQVEPTTIPQFRPSKIMSRLTPEFLVEINEEKFNQLFARSPLLYAGYKRLRSNLKK